LVVELGGRYLKGIIMEVHRQTCQKCGSRKHNNLLVREPGQRPVVFVRCTECEELVARYVLESYYHHGKGLESYLRSVTGSVESGRRMLSEFEETQQEAVAGFQRVMADLTERGKLP
jgi:RNase P subunit RPR2